MLCLFFLSFFCVWVGGGIGDSVGFYPQEAQGRLAVVNGPKCSPVIRSLICPLGARERSGRGGLYRGFWSLKEHRGCRGGDGGEGVAGVFPLN